MSKINLNPGDSIVTKNQNGMKGIPVDARTQVQYYKDIQNIEYAYENLQVIVTDNDPEDLKHPKGIYVVTKLDANNNVDLSYVKSLKETVNVTKEDIGLENVDNVKQVPQTRTINNKPLSSNVTLNANDVGAIPTTEKGANSGVAELDENGKIPNSQLPSYVDDVIEGYLYQGSFYSDNEHTTLITAETGKIYVDISTTESYRYSGSVYVKIGINGEDGFSPYIDETTGNWIDKNGDTGVKAQGEDGNDGNDGNDGFSPVVATSQITNGTRVSIQDATSTKTFDVLNGINGTNGSPGPQGNAGPQGPQGNSGYTGAVGELEVVNNDTDGGATSAWSAERGKYIRRDFDNTFREGDANLEVCDENGNIITSFENGHIKTKNFDSSTFLNFSKNSTQQKLASFNGGDTITLTDLPNIRNNYIISFCSEITTFSDLTLEYSGGATVLLPFVRGKIRITSDKVYITRWGSNTEDNFTHNLIFADYIEVIVVVTGCNRAKLIINSGYPSGNSGGSTYEKEDIEWGGCNGDVTIKAASGGSYTNAELTMYYYGINNRIWIFGDSWADMWPKEFERLGIKNFLIDGFSGRKSLEAVTSFRRCMLLGNKPSILIWMMGMNDKDVNAIDGNYRNAFMIISWLCKENNIKFVPCTIASGTERNHDYKNAFIKASGYDYIDLAAAVNCIEYSSTGYKGVMQNDQVHPTPIIGSMKVSLYLLEQINNLLKTN